MVVGSVLWVGVRGEVLEWWGCQHSGGSVVQNRESPDLRFPEVGISAFLYSKSNIVILPTLPDCMWEPPGHRYCGNFPVSLASVQN